MDPESYFFIAMLLKSAIIVLSVIAIILFGAPFYFSSRERRTRKRKLRQLYAAREPLEDDEFYEKFYGSSNAPRGVVATIRRVLAEEFYLVDMSRLVPQDDFTGNLSIIWGQWSGLDGLESVEVVQRLEEEFGINISNAEAAQMKTWNDIIMTVWWKVQNKNSSTFKVA